ncbi:MAG: DUF4434 domain-containing protein [Gammaproteobacteria bacterium]|nr:DUF4434 domain-containing protein [Gammaproteobacteria bacterium]
MRLDRPRLHGETSTATADGFVIRHLAVLWAVAAALGAQGAIKVEVAAGEGGYTLVRDGVPYLVKGAGIGRVDVATVAERGGNSIRTWGVAGAEALLDAAHRHGLTVSLGLPVAAERFGFDYDDPASIARQRQDVRNAVASHKDHPALLAWIIGNELDMRFTNPRVYDEVNELSKLIHELDPNHPTTTTISALDREMVELVRERAPDLDFVSIQAYGALALMPKAVNYLRTGPFMITEWGPLGHWEVGKTRWGAPIEQTSAEKARHYLKSYRTFIEPFLGPGLGSYVFLWGQKQERTHTWFSLFTPDGESTSAVDVLQFVWTGRAPANQAPVLESLTLARRPAADSVRLVVGKRYNAKVNVTDPDGDALAYQWRVKPESTETVVGGDVEAAIDDIPGLFVGDATQAEVALTAPEVPGTYRLYVMAYDGQGHAAHANIPFLVYGKRR